MKLVKRVTAAAFALLVLLPVLFFRWEPGIRSEADNRMLQENPFSPEEWAKGGDITAKTERFVSDRVGFRDQMLTGFQLLNDGLFHKLVHPSYCNGKDGYIYFNPSIRTADWYYYVAFADMAKDIQDYCAARSVPFLFVLEPEKEAVLPEYLPDGFHYEGTARAVMTDLLEERNVRFLDMTDLMREQTQTGETVYNRKYDAGHWNDLGGFYVTNAILEELHKDFPAVEPNRLSDLEVTEVIQEYLPNSRIPIHETVPSISVPSPRGSGVSPALSQELKRYAQTQVFGETLDETLLSRGAPRTLMFQGSHMNDRGRKFLSNALGEYIYVHNYHNVINFDYYFNIFQPECVIFEVAAYSVRFTSYFERKGMESFRLNPTLESVLAERGEPEALPLEGVSVQKGEALTTVSWTGAPDWAASEEDAEDPYVWAVLDGTAYDMRRSEEGAWETTVLNENFRGGAEDVEIVVRSQEGLFICRNIA